MNLRCCYRKPGILQLASISALVHTWLKPRLVFVFLSSSVENIQKKIYLQKLLEVAYIALPCGEESSQLDYSRFQLG